MADSHVTNLPGEQVLANATKVTRLLPLVKDDPVASVEGNMVCSNYRLKFIPDKKSIAGDVDEEMLNDSQCIPLLSILSVIKVSKEKGKRKVLTAKNSTKKIPEEIEIVTKDLRRIHFDMTHCDRRQISIMVNAIVVYSQPTSFTQLFINDAARHSVQPTEPSNIPSFLTAQDWENEMSRLKTVGWRVTSCNHDFSLSMSLPPFLVVPTTITDTNLYFIRTLHHQGRLPVWCWSHPVTSAALLRSSGPVKDDDSIPSDAGYLWAISMAKEEGRQVNCKAVLPIDVTKECCSVRDIQSSFAKLMDIVIPGSVGELAAADKRWLSGLESTKWLEHVRSCLSVAERVCKALTLEKQPVLLFETDGRDLTCVVSSLTQIMLDPTLRTTAGLESLIQKEWVAMGHPFAFRHKMVSLSESKDESEGFSPVFLLFLDCVFQLMSQCLSAFEFSETHLISLYDASLSGLYSTFLFNSSQEYFAAKNPYKTETSSFAARSDYHSVLPQAWGRWMDALPGDVRERCYNPFHFLFADHVPRRKTQSTSTPIAGDSRSVVLDVSPCDLVQGGSLGLYTNCLAHKQVSDRQRRRSRHDSWVITPSASEGSEHILLPQTMQCHLKFWTGLFFRFIPISNEPFKEVLRVEDLKGQLVRKARHYKDSLKEQELKNWRYRHTMSFIDDTPMFEFVEAPPLLVRSGSASEPSTRSDSITEHEEFFVATPEGLSPSREGCPAPAQHSPHPAHHRHGSPTQHSPRHAHHGHGSPTQHSPRPARHGHGSPGPPKPPRPISKTTVNVQMKGGGSLPGDSDSSIQLYHMTPIATGHSNSDPPPPNVSPLATGRRTSRDSHNVNSWITESEEVDAL